MAHRTARGPSNQPPIGGNTGGGARRGAQLLQRLRERPPTIWYRGEQVKDVTTHPALRGGVETLAKLYDLQWDNAQTCLYESPTTGNSVARSFLMPKTHDELASISKAMQVREDYTHGMMGRVPDYLNRAITGYAAGASFLAEIDPRFGANAVRYYEHLRENDLCLTHALNPPQSNRAVSTAKQADPYLAARIKEETHAGIVIRGSRMLATLPISDEIMVFPSALLKGARKTRLTRLDSASPTTRRGCGSFAARVSTTAARTSTIPSARASRRWMPSWCSTTSSCPGKTFCSTAT